jgi:anthranilate synthase/aminodeoxychorismate synthase-like glutamine amidotransferase
MILLIDNFDSFTFNLYHYMGEVLQARGQWREDAITVRRNDALSADQALAMDPRAIVLSPGPCTPDQAGICLELVRKAAGRVPILGVCLGHQAIGQVFGGKVVRAPLPMHGKVGVMHHRGSDIFAGIPNPFRATRYHSLVVERDSLPADLTITAWNDDGLVMGMAHRALPVWGVQFHPESIASEHGRTMLGNFLDLARGANMAEVAA